MLRPECSISMLLVWLLLASEATSTAFAESSTQPSATPVDPSESILSEYTPQVPPNPNPPRYTLLRFNEDYSYLSDPRNRTDFLDPLKYIPLNPNDPYSYLSLGGEVRERYEHYTNPGFGIPPQPDHQDILLQRITFDVDTHFNANVRVFVQGISGSQFGDNRNAPPVNQDPIDLQQAFIDFKFASSPQSPDYTVIRTGRFEMTYGSGRLVATRAAPNIPFKFDGIQTITSVGGGKIYAFVTKPGREHKYEFDDEESGQLFWGIYGTTPLLVPSLGLKADLYYLGFKDDRARFADGAGEEDRETVGTRLFGKFDGFDYDIEPIIQTGRFNGRNILAWSIGSSVGYRFENAPMTPRLGLLFDVVSGNTSHGTFGTFNPLYFKSGYFDDASLIRPSNLIDIHPTLQLLPRKDLMLAFGSDVLWRYTTKDGVYAPPGNLELPPDKGSRYIATTAEASAQWQINRHLSFTASYVHFFTGNYVHQSHGGDVDFFGSWLTFTW